MSSRSLGTRAVGGALAASCALALSPLRVAAQEDFNATEVAAARALAIEGIKLADGGRCDEAIDKLGRAEKLHHAPVVLGRLGECQVIIGKLVEGTENLRKVLREPLAPDAPAVLTRARERAQSVLEKAKGRIGALNISVRGPREGAPVTVTVDGEPMNVVLLDAERPTNPGEHVIEASAPGFAPASARVTLGYGDKASVVLTLEPDPEGHAAGVAPPAVLGAPASAADGEAPPSAVASEMAYADRAAAAPGSDAMSEPDLTGAYVAWATGGAAVVVGSVFGWLAIDGKADLEEQCPNRLCPESSEDRLDSARRASTLATVSFALGGAALGLGTFLYFNASPSEETPAATASGQEPAPSLAARAWIGLGQVGVSGQF